MNRTLTSAILTALLITSAFGSQSRQPNFSGTWVLDKSGSEGLPPGTEQMMTISQTGDQLNLENKIRAPGGSISIFDTFIINGKEVAVTEKRNDDELKGTRVSKWLTDGNGFGSREELNAVGGDGLPVIQQITRKWLMAQDGKTFTVEADITSPAGTQHTKRTFRKQ